MSEAKQQIQSEIRNPFDDIMNDHVSKSELSKWCESKLKRLSILRSIDHHYFEKFSAELLEKFCKGGE